MVARQGYGAIKRAYLAEVKEMVECFRCKKSVFRVVARGCCTKCYNFCVKRIKAKITTWEELEERGESKPKRTSEDIIAARKKFFT